MNEKKTSSNDYLEYQSLRLLIPDNPVYKNFEKYIKNTPKNIFLGLKREWRAYWWMVKKYPKREIFISTMNMDKDGVDLYTGLKKWSVEFEHYTEGNIVKIPYRNWKYFAVSGPADKEKHSICNYKIIVTDTKIYLKKRDKGAE